MDMKSVWEEISKIKDPEIHSFIVNALLEQKKREKGCEYCDPKNVDYYYAGNVPNYCKHCGRKLNDRC